METKYLEQKCERLRCEGLSSMKKQKRCERRSKSSSSMRKKRRCVAKLKRKRKGKKESQKQKIGVKNTRLSKSI